jgi:hypothetical protein
MQCGHPLDDGDRFCDVCGTVADPLSQQDVMAGMARYCAGCGAMLPEGQALCPLCGNPAGQMPEPPPPQVASLSDTLRLKLPAFFQRGQQKPTSVAIERGTLSMRAFLVVIILLAMVAAVFLWQYLPLFLPAESYPLADAVLYVKSDGSLTLSAPDGSPYVITGSYKPIGNGEKSAKASADGRYLAYVSRVGDGRAALYLLDLSRLGKTELQPQEGTLLAEDVAEDFGFSRKGDDLVFLTATGQLCTWQNDAVAVLDEKVTAIVDIAERQVLYTKAGSDGGMAKHNLLLRSLDPLVKDPQLIVSDMDELLDYTKTYTAFLYTQSRLESSSGDDGVEIGYFDARTGQTHTLASGVTGVLDASAERRMVVFAKEQPLALRYEDLVDDPLATADESLQEPSPADFGLPEDYVEIYEMEDPDAVADTDTDTDIDESPQEMAEEDLYYYDYMNYRHAVEEYEQKLTRDITRETIRRSINALSVYNDKTYELYIYQDDASHLLEDNLLLKDGHADIPLAQAVKADLEKNSIVYVGSNAWDIPRFTLEEWAQPGFRIRDHLFTALPQSLCWASADGASFTIYQGGEQDRIEAFTLSSAGDKLLYLTAPRAGEELSGTLNYQTLPLVEVANPVLVDVDVDLLPENGDTFNGAILYGKALSDDRYNLYASSLGQEPAQLAADISQNPAFTVENGGKTLLYYRRFATGSNLGYDRGELYLYIRQERMIIGDVYDYEYRGDRLIYLLRNGNPEGLYDLQVYREGGVSPLDNRVRQVLPISRNT